MICKKCGAENDASSKFCFSCGELLEETKVENTTVEQTKEKPDTANASEKTETADTANVSEKTETADTANASEKTETADTANVSETAETADSGNAALAEPLVQENTASPESANVSEASFRRAEENGETNDVKNNEKNSKKKFKPQIDVSVVSVFSKKKRFLTKLMCFSLISAVFINGCCAENLLNRNPKNFKDAVTAAQSTDSSKDTDSSKEKDEKKLKSQERKEEGHVSYIPDSEDDLDNVIADKDDAIKILESIQGQFGITNASEEFYCSDTKEVMDDTIYYMQQKYDGYDVEQGLIILSTDSSGNLTDVSGHYQNTEDFDFEDPISSSDAYDILKKYAKSTYKIDAEKYDVDTDDLKIYTLQDTSYLAYCYDIGTHTILVDAITGDVISDSDNLTTSNVTGDDTKYPKLQGQEVTQTLDYSNVYGGNCVLKDEERRINILIPEDDYSRDIFNYGSSDYKTNEINFELEKKAEGSEDYKLKSTDVSASAVDALANLERVYDFYQTSFGITGVKNDSSYTLPVIMNINKYNGDDYLNNAAMFGGSYMIVNSRSDDSKEYSYALDVMGHEWTHGVVFNSNSNPLGNVKSTDDYDRQNSIQLAINEGLADVMGEMVEDWSDGTDAQKNDGSAMDNSCNWVTEQIRDASGSDKGSQLYDARDFKDGVTDCHYGSTVISHAAYEMCNGDNAIGTDVLASLEFQSFVRCTSATDWIDYRKIVENLSINAIKDKEMEAEQIETVLDAFDSVGIDNTYDYDLEPGAKLTVYDVNNKVYKNYNIKFYNVTDPEEAVAEDDVTSKTYTLPDEIVPGIYNVVITDNAENANKEATKETFTLVVNDNSIKKNAVVKYESKDKIYTNFGAESKEVVLCIDESGSMNGEPLTETKASAAQFAEKIFEINPAASVSVVTFSNEASEIISNSSDLNDVVSAINGISSTGGTNLYDGIDKSNDLFDYDSATEKILVIMSDGLPTEGNTDYDSIKKYCEKIRDKNVEIYSLGFFHNSTGSDLSSGISLMRSLTIAQNYINVSSPADLSQAFELLALQSSGEKYYEATIACPVNVEVTYNGETLSSDPDDLKTKTSFGYLFFEPEDSDSEDGEDSEESNSTDSSEDSDDTNYDNMKKVLKLKDGLDYEIKVTGTDDGSMDYSISYPDKDGKYTDVRTFKNIKVSKSTLISTITSKTGKNILNVDKDGDGVIDKQYAASKNGEGKAYEEKQSKLLMIEIIVVEAAAIILWIALEMISKVRKNKKRKCSNCNKVVPEGNESCPNCGMPYKKISLILPQKVVRKPQKKGAVITKLIVTVLAIALCVTGICMYYSAPSNAYKHITENDFTIAESVYKDKVKNNFVSKNYFDLYAMQYMNKVEAEYEDGKLNAESAETICNAVKELKGSKSAKKAKEILKTLDNK